MMKMYSYHGNLGFQIKKKKLLRNSMIEKVFSTSSSSPEKKSNFDAYRTIIRTHLDQLEIQSNEDSHTGRSIKWGDLLD